MNPNIVLITGGLGYVGTELCKVLLEGNNRIIVVGHSFKPERVAWAVKNRISYHQRDIFNISDLLKNVDICYHLAAITDVPRSTAASTPAINEEIIRVGTGGTRYLIENINKNAKVIFASTQIVYDGVTKETLNITEDIEPCPSVTYSISKRQSELDLLNSGLNYVIARFGTTYGYNESVRINILPNLFAKLTAQGSDLKVFGPNNYKPLIGINDLARCLNFLANGDYTHEIFHCISENIKVIDVARLCKLCNDKINIVTTDDPAPNGFSLSNQKLLNTGFKFEQNLPTELSKMIDIWSNK